jgi:hypothetical protein
MTGKAGCIAICAAWAAMASAPERPLRVVTTDQADFHGGTIRLDNTYGQVSIESWDEPRVEVTVTRTAFRQESPKDQEAGKTYLNRIKVSVKQNGNDVEITTEFPGRNRLVRSIWGLGDFNLDYRVKAPRDAKLAIRHGVGDVVIEGMAGDIDASVKSGDLILQLPDPEKYAIDAQCKLGKVYTDFEGAYRSPLWMGQKFAGGSGHAVHLRVGVGGISIQRLSVP